MKSFSTIDLLPSLQETLAEKGFARLTEIQELTLPALLEGRSMVGVAETGGGKTLAYALPILHRLKVLENEGHPVKSDGRPRAVVLVPARELGEQVARVFKPFTHTTRLRVRSALGGTDFDVVRKNVSGPIDILIATPGRLIKLLDRALLDLSDTRVLVFDEADQMLDQGFLPAALRIAEACPPKRQMALFSATVPPRVQSLIQNLFARTEVVRSGGSHQLVEGLKTDNIQVPDGERFPVLENLLGEEVEGGTMIFTNTREQCDRLARAMEKIGHSVVVYRGEMDKVERRKNLKLFRDQKIRFLISTDLASRGLDVEHVGRVINYNMPQQMENYIHRVGRTARAGRKGRVINFITERDAQLASKISTLRSRRNAAENLEAAREWPAEPAHKAPLPKPLAVPRGRITLKTRKA